MQSAGENAQGSSTPENFSLSNRTSASDCSLIDDDERQHQAQLEQGRARLESSLKVDEKVLASDCSKPAKSKKQMRWQLGFGVLFIPLLAIGKVPLLAVLCITVGAIVVLALVMGQSASTTVLWAITNKRVIKIVSGELTNWNLEQVKLYSPRVQGGCIAFYTGRTSASQVTMYFLQEPQRTLAILIEAVNNARLNEKGNQAKLVTVNEDPQWMNEIGAAFMIGMVLSIGYFSACVVPGMSQAHATAAAIKAASISYIFGGAALVGLIWTFVYIAFRRKAT